MSSWTEPRRSSVVVATGTLFQTMSCVFAASRARWSAGTLGPLRLAMKGALRRCDGGSCRWRRPRRRCWRAPQLGVVFQSGAGGKMQGAALTATALASLGMIVGVAVIIKGEDVILGNSKLCLLPKQIEHSFTQLLGAESFSGRCVGSSRSHPGTRPDPRSNGSSKRLNGSRRLRRRVLCAARPWRPRASRSSCWRTAFASSIPPRWCATSFVARRMTPRSRPPQRKHRHRPTVMLPARKNPS